MTTISETTPAPTPWRDILDGDWWKTGRAECGCETWANICCELTWADMSPVSATLHEASTCGRGEHRAEVETALAYELGLRIPAGAGPADVVVVDRDRLRSAQAAVAERERAAAASRSQDFVQRRIAAISDRVADESEFNAWYATVDGQPLTYVEAMLREVADHPVFEARMYAGYLAAEQAKPLPNPTQVRQFLAAVAAHTERGRREAEDLLNPAAAVARTVAGWDGVSMPQTPPALPESGSLAPAPGVATPIAPAPVVDPADDPEGLALIVSAAEAERADEYGVLFSELAPALLAQRVIDIPNEIAALMRMTISDRAEAVAAVRAGRMARLDLVPSDLLPTARGNRAAWTRLREGTATWSVDDLQPFTDAEMEALMNPNRPEPQFGGLFYDRGVQILAGSGGIGKTWIALNACIDAIPAVPHLGGGVRVEAMYLDLDQNFELYARLGMFGLARAHIQQRTLEITNVPRDAAERGASTVGMLWAIIADLEENPPKVVVVDSLTRILSAVDEGNSNDNDAATRVLSTFDRLAEKCAVIILDHTGHEGDRPRGASAKVDAVRQVVTVAETKFDADRNPGVIGGGKLISTKDRDGGVRAAYRDPADQSARPELGLMPIIKDPETGKFRVELISAAMMAGARERRESTGGIAFATEARKVILEVVDAAARAAVTAPAAKAAGGKPVPPLSARQIEETAWPTLAENTLGGKRSDVRAAVQQLLGEGKLVEYLGAWGSVPGKRYRAAGGITNGVLDPVDIDALA